MRKCLVCHKEKELTEYFEKNGNHSRICKGCTPRSHVPDRYITQTRFGHLEKIKRYIVAKLKGLLK